jgi:hypothetical protein
MGRGRDSARLHGITALVLGATALIVLTVLFSPSTAIAATDDPDAKYYVSTATTIEPAVPGLAVIAHDGGKSVTLTNQTGKQVVVLGYSGEDYLRFDGLGVAVNSNSLTAALNADGGRAAPPAGLSGKAKLPAKWRPVAGTNSFTWQDFRTQWSAERRPPIVTADPHGRHQVFAWAIQLRVDSKPTLVRGNVTWIGTPGPNRIALAITVGSIALFVALVLAIGLQRRRIRRRASRVVHVVRPQGRTTHSTGVR